MRYPIEVRERRYVKSYEFLYLTKNGFENVAVHVLKNFMIKQKNVEQMHLKLHQKGQLKKQQKQLVILYEIKVRIKL